MKYRCAYCKQYGDSDNMVSSGMSRFCSKDHMYSHQQGLFKVKSPSKSSKELSKAIRDRVMESDGGRCRFCGGGRNLAVHHIRYRSEFSDGDPNRDAPSNLITLCNEPCHLTFVHGNKGLYQPLCFRVTWLRELHGDRSSLIVLEELAGSLELRQDSVMERLYRRLLSDRVVSDGDMKRVFEFSKEVGNDGRKHSRSGDC